MTAPSAGGRQLPLDLGHRPALGHDDFLVAPSNAEAISGLDQWPDWPGHALAIHGPAGCGKTHLAHVWQAQSSARLIAANDLRIEDVAVLAAGGAAIAVEDADTGVVEQALLHLFNLLKETGGSLLLSGQLPPSKWSIALPDLRSRLAAIPVIEVEPPDDQLLEAVLVKLFHDRQLRVEQDVVIYLLARMERSFDAARVLVDQIDREALAAGRKVTVPFVRTFLPAD
jgi:DnaA regulatory inactivator Hda